jgi:hypothetical protein
MLMIYRRLIAIEILRRATSQARPWWETVACGFEAGQRCDDQPNDGDALRHRDPFVRMRSRDRYQAHEPVFSKI